MSTAARSSGGQKPSIHMASLSGEGEALASCRARRPPGKDAGSDACSARERPRTQPGDAPQPADGEGQNRTGDTTIFSRVLYRLSYLAAKSGQDGSGGN